MDFTTFKKRVYKKLQDDPDNPFRFDDDGVAEAATDVFQDYVRKSGKNQVRISLNMVQSERVYQLPVDTGRLTGVWIVPEVANNSPQAPIPEVGSIVIPATPTEEGDPAQYSVNSAENPGFLSLVMDPAPRRTTDDAIVVEYEVNDEIEVDMDPLPFPDSFVRAFVWLTAANMLSDLNDQTSLSKAQIYESKGNDILSSSAIMDSIVKSRQYIPRVMP